MSTSVVWFRRDLRLTDNPAWTAASRSESVCALFVVDPRLFAAVTERRRRVLMEGLADLDRSLAALGGRLRVEQGLPEEVVPAVAAQVGAGEIHHNMDVTPFATSRDEAVAGAVDLIGWNGSYVHQPGSILTNSGAPYRVFTPFYKAWNAKPARVEPAPGTPQVLDRPGDFVLDSVSTEYGEDAALKRLDRFVNVVNRYQEIRDRPDLDLTSRLSIDLKYGFLSPRLVIETVGDRDDGARAFIRQIAWRDFWAQMLFANPETVGKPLRPRYGEIKWRNNPEELTAWKEGRTGFPLVDAGMRQLAAEGWMNNRVRMVVASFLVKDLLVDWRIGERYFRRHLLDGDVAQNVGNWQWVAGTGADAAPYFRVFNPVLQSKRFDPDGDYIRRWLPELQALPKEWIHAPWEAPPFDLSSSGVYLGENYPAPIVDHAMARQRALDVYADAVS